jgi:hypothetical protein
MADTLTPEEKKRLTEELTKYANEGASDDDLRQFRNAFISELKKKGGGQPASGTPAGQPGKPSAPSFGQKVINEALVSGEPVMKGVKKQPTEKKPYQDITYRREELPSETTQMPETPIIKAAKKDFKQTVVKPQIKLQSTPEELEEIEKKTETFDKDNLTLNNYQSSADIVNDLESLYDEDVNVVYTRIQRRPDLYRKYSGRSMNEAPSSDPTNEQAWQERNKDRDIVYQNYLADLESQRNKHSVATKQANDLSDSILTKKITPETYKNYTSEKTEMTSFGEISAGTVVDMDKVDEEATAIAEKYNLPTDGEAWRLLKNRIKNQVAFEIRRPAALEKLKATEPELYKKRQELFESGFTFDDSTYARVESELIGLQSQYEQDAKNEFNIIDAEYKSKAEALNSQYAQFNAATEAKQSELTKLYQSGQIDRLAYESAWGQLEDEKKSNHENYTKQFPSPEEYVRKSNEINSKYNRKFDLQKKSLIDKADAEIKAAYQKYASEYKEDPELLRQMNEAYSKAFEDAEKEALDKMGEAADLSVIPLSRFYQSTLSSLGGVFRGWGGSLDSKAFEMLGESMEQNFMMPAAKTEEFKDWLNPQNLQLLSGQLAGSMIPSVVVTATATTLTGGMGIIPLVAGGLAGWGSETLDIVGRSYLDTFDRTNGNVAEANKAAERSLQSQYDLMWAYSLDALPFLKASWLTKIPKAGARMAAGGAIELGTEFIQEYPQNIAEENISRGQDPWTNLGQALQDTDKMKQTLISIGPVAALGAAGQVGSNSRKQQAIDRYVALQQKSELSSALPDQRRQYVQSMVFDRGSKFASGVVGALYANGNIDQDTAADMLMQVAKADKIRESGKEAGLKGDKLNIYGFYTARAEEAERNAAKFGNDPILSESYKQMAKQYRDAGLDFMKGGKPDLLTITYADKSQEFLMPEDANALFANPAALASLNKKKISIEAYNDKGESIKVLDELKSRAETYVSEKRYVAPVTRTSPLQAQRDAIQQRIQELDKQGPEMAAKERAKAIKDIEDQAAQEEKTSDQRDLEIEELQAKREALGVSEVDAFFSDMKPLVGTTVQRLEQGQNAPQGAIKVASDYLYAKYKELTAMKADPNRMMTVAQIESIQAQIEQDLQTLAGNPPSQQTQENDQENIQGVPSEVGVGQEPVAAKPIEVTSEEAPATGGVLQAQGQEEVVTPQVTEEPTPKPTRKTRLAKLFETSDGEEAVPLIEQSLSESGIKVEVKDDADYNDDDRIKRSQGRGSEGMFVADDGTIILNRDKIKGEWGKTIVFHEGIHPVVNIIRNTDPKRYRAIVDGLKSEAARNNAVAKAAADIAASEEYQRRGPESIEDETVVETMARVATGDIDINTFKPSFREKFIEFMNDIAKAFGLRPILTNSPRVEVKRLAEQINKMLNEGGKISDVVGKKNVKEFQNKISLTDTNSVFSNTSSQARFEMKFLEDSEDFAKLVEEGRVVHNASLDDINGETVVIHNPDNFSTGEIKFRGKDLVKGEGGVYFVLLYNDVWASGKKSSASQLASLINESLQKSTDGKGRLVLVKGDSSKNLTSVKGAKALMGVMEILADDGLIPLSAFRKALNIAGKKYGINFDGRNDAKSIHKDIQDKFMNVSNSSFERRGDFVRDVIDAIANQNVLSKEAIAEIAESIGAKRKMTTFSKASILDSVAYATSERMLRDIPNSHVYAVIETSSKVKPEFIGKHESYPWHIVTEDGSKPILHILKDRPFYNDAFVAAKSTEKVKEGERFGDVSRAGLAQRGMGLAKVETKPTGQPSQGIPRTPKEFAGNVGETIDRIKAAISEDGATLNLDGTTYEDGGLVVPAGSLNVAQDEVTAEGLFDFLKDNEENISSDIFKIGLYKFPDRPEVSYDLNIVIPREYRDVALKFGELSGQESLFDLDTFENIKTGSDGKNPRKFTAQELAEIAKDLSEGRLPKIVGGKGQPSMMKRTPALASVEETAKALKGLSKDVVKNDEPLKEWTRHKIGDTFEVNNVYKQLPESAATPSNGNYTLETIPVSATDLNYSFSSGKGKIEKGVPALSREHWEWDNEDGYQTEQLNMIKEGFDTAKREPIIVEKGSDGMYVVVDGHHRLTIAKELSRGNILALVREGTTEKNPKTFKSVAEAYHKAKEDGTNPELVKAVEDLIGKPKQGQPSVVKRTPAQIRQAVEDGVDAVEAAIAEGMDPQQAVDENISNQDWYGDLSAAQKEQLNEILQDEFGATASEPKLQNNAQRVADLWEKGGKEAKAEIKNILETDPELSYIYNNFPKITKQLQEQGLLTKTENCP